MWLLRFIIAMRNSNGLIRRGKIRPNSRCWSKLFGKTLWLPTHKARENPKHLLAHVFGVALRETGPMPLLRYTTHQDHVLNANRRATGRGTAPPPLKAEVKPP
jgi:hypothetical protein